MLLTAASISAHMPREKREVHRVYCARVMSPLSLSEEGHLGTAPQGLGGIDENGCPAVAFDGLMNDHPRCCTKRGVDLSQKAKNENAL